MSREVRLRDKTRPPKPKRWAGRGAGGAKRGRRSRTGRARGGRGGGRFYFHFRGKKSRGGEQGHGDAEPGSKHGFLRNAVWRVSKDQISLAPAAKTRPA